MIIYESATGGGIQQNHRLARLTYYRCLLAFANVSAPSPGFIRYSFCFACLNRFSTLSPTAAIDGTIAAIEDSSSMPTTVLFSTLVAGVSYVCLL